MKNLFLFFTITTCFLMYSQNNEAKVETLAQDFYEKLEARGISIYFSTKHYCSGTNEMFMVNGKRCFSSGTYVATYVVWNEDGKDFIKKIDNCGLFHSVPLENNIFSEFYNQEMPALVDDEVKPYRSLKYPGEPELRKDTQPCFRGFRFKTSSRVVEKAFNLFDISNDSDGDNKNYVFNQSLKLVELDKMFDQIIPQLDFKRQEQ